MMIRPLLLAAIVVSTGCQQQGEEHRAPTAPTPTDIVGIDFSANGKPIGECGKHEEGGYIVYSLPYAPLPCWQVSTRPLKALESAQQLEASHGASQTVDVHIDPPFGVDATAMVTFADGVPQEVLLSTNRIDGQRNVFDALEAKYGKPKTVAVRKMQNAFGAQLESIEATWQLPNLFVSFSGAVDMKSGRIHAISAKALQARPAPPPPARF